MAKTPVRRKPDEGATPGMTSKKTTQRQGFKTSEFIVYPSHGVGQIVAIEEQEVAGAKLELFVINFVKDKMTLRVPTAKIASVGTRNVHLVLDEVDDEQLDLAPATSCSSIATCDHAVGRGPDNELAGLEDPDVGSSSCFQGCFPFVRLAADGVLATGTPRRVARARSLRCPPASAS